MAAKSKTEEPEDQPRRRYARWAVVVLAVFVLVWLAAWLVQRSFQNPVKKRALQSWMDEKLNADVSLLGDMVVRANLVRDSRLFLHDVEIEHSNPVFPGKFARIQRIGCWVPPWSLLHVYPGPLDILLTGMHLNVDENEFGEWSTNGLMQPLSAGNARFPFTMPRISDWKMNIEDSSLTVRRRGYELRLDLLGGMSGAVGGDRIQIHNDKCDFTFGKIGDDEDQPRKGTASPVNMRVKLGEKPGDTVIPVAGRCAARVKRLPFAMLPFFVDGIPMESTAGVFDGLIRYDEHPDASGELHIDGELSDVPLAVFGLPRNSPLRVTWPIGPKEDNLLARIHMGPSGFGAFEITATLDTDGRPRQLNMRGDVADLDAIPAFFTKYSRWPDWLSRIFPSIHWRTGSWRGFGWRGENLQLSLSRSTGGLNLSGEGEMMGGRVRLLMTPDQIDAPITVSAERLDPVRLSVRLSRLLPEAFRARINGSGVNLTWRGYPSATGELEDWGTGMVWSKPVVDISASGEFWKAPGGIARAVAEAVEEWGGGNVSEIMAISREGGIPLDQLSIVSETDFDGGMAVEFRAYGEAFGQATGLIESRRDGAVEGEFLLAGPSRLLRALEKSNPEFARVLDLLANESAGLRTRMIMEQGGTLKFTYPFLDDARRLREEMRKSVQLSFPQEQ